MRRRSVLLAGAFIAACVLAGAERPGPRTASLRSGRPTSENEPKDEIGDAFAFEAAARYNEGIIANIDAIDTSLTTILAGNVALLVFVIDKIKELEAGEAVSASVLMGLSTTACLIAYAVGFSVRASNRDGARPRTFIPDLLRRPGEAMSTAVIDLVRAGEDNLAVRFAKKSLALFAIVFLFAGATVAAFARLHGEYGILTP